MSKADGDAFITSRHTHFNFHLPNGHARSTVESNSQYHAISGEEVDVTDDEDNDDTTLVVGFGVETTAAWHSMTSSQHALVRIAFGILGATVLLPL